MNIAKSFVRAATVSLIAAAAIPAAPAMANQWPKDEPESCSASGAGAGNGNPRGRCVAADNMAWNISYCAEYMAFGRDLPDANKALDACIFIRSKY